MRAVVTASVPVLYVHQLDRSRDFYALFGYAEQRSGRDGPDAAWSYLQHGEHAVLLACVQPPLIPVELPLLIYLYVDGLAELRERIAAAGHPVEVSGPRAHAVGGELRVSDPDGNVVLVGQRGPGGAAVVPGDDPARSSLIRQAAEEISRRGGAPASCQIGAGDGTPCPQPAEVKLADPWGETVWACLTHADEALINARGAFIATDDGTGLGPWLRARRPAA